MAKVFTSPIPSFLPGGQEYEKSVATSNLLYRFSRPYLVIQPESPAHVQTVVKTAVSRGLRITVKNGGHSFAGFSSTDRGILLDLSRMQDVRLHSDPETDELKAVTLAGGAQWGHAYKALVAGRHDGYMVSGGRCPTVGVSGFVLGGGLGPFTREIGMGCDSLTEAKIVTADGALVTVGEQDDRDSDKGKLFWALRGGGCGSFGVVVELKMKVPRVRKHVVTGGFTYHSELDKPFVETMKKIYRFDWPDTATIDTHWQCEASPGNPSSSVRFVIYFDGDKPDFDRLVDRAIGIPPPHPRHHHQGGGHNLHLVEEEVPPRRPPTTDHHPCSLADLIKERTLTEPSTLLLHESLVLQWWEETLRALPTNKSYSVYTSFIFERKADITDAATDIVRAHMDTFHRVFSQDTASLEVAFVHAGGAASRVGPHATAFPWREGTYFAYIMIRWSDKWLSSRVREFFDGFKARLRPLSMADRAAYVNFTDVAMRDYATAYYGSNYPKLQEVKKIWDPFDYFHVPQGIRLPGVQDGLGGAAGEVVDWVDLAHHQWENPSRAGLPPPRDDFPDVIRNLADLMF
jgi:FAD/FMN-containing dehydrogenase